MDPLEKRLMEHFEKQEEWDMLCHAYCIVRLQKCAGLSYKEAVAYMNSVDGRPGPLHRGCLDRAEGWSPTVAEAAGAWNAGITADYAREMSLERWCRRRPTG